MSTFGGIVNEIKGISIDRFDGYNLSSNVFFLSHCHTDHMNGLNSNEFVNHLRNGIGRYIYMSKISEIILKNQIPALKQFIKPLNILESHSIPLLERGESNDENCLQTILIPAAHCPGSVMFLFRTTDHLRILYTGDFRLSPEVLPKVKELNDSNGTAIHIDKLYFDSTFWNEKFLDFPSRDDSCDAICDIIKKWTAKGKDYIISLNIPARYGSEFLYMEIYKRLKIPVHVTDDVYKVYSRISDMDSCITMNSESTQIHCCGNKAKLLNCRKSISNLKLQYIRPTAMRWSHFDLKNSEIFTKSKDENTFFVCYSSHSSYNELKDFINYFKPSEVEPCVVPTIQSSEFHSSINNFCKKYLRRSNINNSLNISDDLIYSDCKEKGDIHILKKTYLPVENITNLNKRSVATMKNVELETIIINSSSEEEEEENNLVEEQKLSTFEKIIESQNSSPKANYLRKKIKFF